MKKFKVTIELTVERTWDKKELDLLEVPGFVEFAWVAGDPGYREACTVKVLDVQPTHEAVL